MAKKKAEANDIITQIQEDVNREQMMDFFKNHGKRLVTLAVIAVLGIAGFEGWKHYDLNERSKSGDKMYNIISNFAEEKDTKNLAFLGTKNGYKEVAAMVEANLSELHKDEAASEKAYAKIANDTNANQALRELAKLNIISIRLNKNPTDSGVEPDLKALTSDSSAFKYTALEMLAAYYKGNNKYAESKAAYQKIADDENAPSSLSGRAKSMLSSY